jgi:anti-sigma factor ChrR (cupin superfamily)
MADGIVILPDLLRRVWADQIVWSPFRDGVEIHEVYSHPGGPAAALLRYAPGAVVPLHEHSGHEHILVLTGSQVDGRGEHLAGTLVVNLPGTRHTVTSPRGCVVYVVWARPVVFV